MILSNTSKKSKKTLSKYEKIQIGLGIWTSFYRANPHRFAIDYLGMRWMKPFQHLLLNILILFPYVMIIASRGMGKSMIVAAAICVKCILWPGTEVCVTSGNRGQAINVLAKIIDKFYPESLNLRSEIKEYSLAPASGYIRWHNGSMVKVATARETSRSARTNWLIADEFVQIKKNILDSVLKKFKAAPRTPGFYNKPEYKDYPKETNYETYISSAYYKVHYSWAKFNAFYNAMLKGQEYVCCGFPYQLPVKAGYYPKEQILNDMREDDFDSIAWSMEMDSLFWGESANAFFSFENVSAVRNILTPLYPLPFYSKLKDPKIKPPAKRNGEIRLLAMDIATAGGSRNDATCISLLQMLPLSNKQYIRNVLYLETIEGGHGQNQAIRLKQLYDDFQADFVVVDTNGGNAPYISDGMSVTRKKTGTLKWESEWKAYFKRYVTRNA